eukprot:m.26626 g.26626  ORF g.26626 m.26626 type:complete len:1563 (-) comp8951_c0_seq1:277-4965(-)
MASRDSTQPGATRPNTRSSAKHRATEEAQPTTKRRRAPPSSSDQAASSPASIPLAPTPAPAPAPAPPPAPPLASAPAPAPASAGPSSSLARLREKASRARQHQQRRARKEMARLVSDPELSSAEDEEGGMGAAEGAAMDSSAIHALLARLHGGEGHRGLFPFGGGASGRFAPLLEGLRSGEDPVIEGALNDLSQTLLMASEDSLAGFRPDQFIPILHEQLNVEHNPQLAILACRCLTNMLDAVPTSSAAVATCIPTLCSKLLCIEYIDLAEQCLTTIAKLATDQGAALLQAGGLNAVLAYMDFFPTHLQRDAVAAAANICKNVTRTSLSLVQDSLPQLCALLQSDKDKTMRESACTAIERIVVGLRSNPSALATLGGSGIIPPLLFLLSNTPSRDRLFGSAVRVLGTLARHHAPVQRELFEHHIVSTLTAVLSAEVGTPTEQLGDVITLFTELFPVLPSDMFYVQLGAAQGLSEEPVWEWQGDDAWQLYNRRDATRLETAFQARVPSATLLIGGQPYVIRLDQMTQTNRLTGNSRRLRRTDVEAVPPAVSPDERGAFLAAQPKYLEATCTSILPLLFDVINSCGSIAIRRRVLDALLRLLAAAPPPLLIESLRSISVSSQLAQMLGSIDVRTSAAALQMVQLLAQKLPDVFNVYFRRKGVLFGITKLAQSDGPVRQASTPTTTDSKPRRRGRHASEAAEPPTEGSRDDEMRANLATHAKAILRDTFRILGGAADPLADPHAAMGELRNLSALAQQLQSEPVVALARLAEIFASPERAPSAFELEKSDLDQTLLRFLSEQDFAGLDRTARAAAFLTTFGKVDGALTALVMAVQERLAGLPAFAVNESRDRRRDLSALSAPIKLRLERDPTESGLREFNQSVMIEPLAPIQAIEDFLWPRVRLEGGSGSSGSARRPQSRGGRSLDDAAEEELMLARSPSMPDTDDANRSTDVVEVRPVGEPPAAEHDAPGRPRLTLSLAGHPLPSSMSIYVASSTYSPSAAAGEGEGVGPELFSALNSATCTIQYRVWRPEDDPANAAGAASSEASKAANLSPFESALLAPPLPLPPGDSAIAPLGLLRALHGVVFRHNLLEVKTAETLFLPPPTAFVNSNVAAKVLRQVTDFDCVCQGTAAPICRAVMAACPFMCPFEVRLRFLHYTAFGPARALQRYKADNGGSEDEPHDRRRLNRTKVRLPRERVLDSAGQIFSTHASSSALLEFEFTNEHGTGLGPTLEFYSLASRELQRAALGLWRPSDDGAEHVFHREGLYPMPRKTVPAPILKHFDTLGRLMGRALLDGRLVDITLSNAFYAWLLDEDANLGFEELQVVDSALYASLLPLHKIWLQYSAGTTDPATLTLNGVKIEDLCLSFTLPGYPDFELVPGGADDTVTIARLGEYVDRVVAATLRDGVRAQMKAFVSGFTAVVSPSKIALFTATELDRVFCGLRYHPWDPVELAAACRTEHGFTNDSDVVRWLFDIMAGFGPEDQRSFISFITGCPNLPIGGFRGLRPPLTIVPKSRGEQAAHDLPSVMTCQNYLKIPEYTSRARLAERLVLAMREGQGSFLLS